MGRMESDRVEYDYNFDTRVRRSLVEEYNTLEQSFSKLDAKLSFHLAWNFVIFKCVSKFNIFYGTIFSAACADNLQSTS